MSVFLISSVGGSPEPVVAALVRLRPERARFVVSPQSAAKVEQEVIPLAGREGFSLGPGQYDTLRVQDPQDFQGAVQALRGLEAEVYGWQSRGADFQVLVDFTCGTKCMSAALALVAHRWRCRFVYVGGEERTKGGIGVVVSGTELLVHSENPWNALGYQAAEDALVLFDQQAYASAGQRLGRAISNVSAPDLKRELGTLKSLAEAFDDWDRFQHRRAKAKVKDVLKNANDLRHLLGPPFADELLQALERHVALLSEISEAKGPSQPRILDLLANAARRCREGRYDDAVARLYRATEAYAQHLLDSGHGIPDTKSVPGASIPEPLRSEWVSDVGEDTVEVPLQRAFQLLKALGDPAGARFLELGLAAEKSPLQARNASILAHGFEPVSESLVNNLMAKVLELCQVGQDDLVKFPALAREVPAQT